VLLNASLKLEESFQQYDEKTNIKKDRGRHELCIGANFQYGEPYQKFKVRGEVSTVNLIRSLKLGEKNIKLELWSEN